MVCSPGYCRCCQNPQQQQQQQQQQQHLNGVVAEPSAGGCRWGPNPGISGALMDRLSVIEITANNRSILRPTLSLSLSLSLAGSSFDEGAGADGFVFVSSPASFVIEGRPSRLMTALDLTLLLSHRRSTYSGLYGGPLTTRARRSKPSVAGPGLARFAAPDNEDGADKSWRADSLMCFSSCINRPKQKR